MIKRRLEGWDNDEWRQGIAQGGNTLSTKPQECATTHMMYKSDTAGPRTSHNHNCKDPYLGNKTSQTAHKLQQYLHGEYMVFNHLITIYTYYLKGNLGVLKQTYHQVVENRGFQKLNR